MDRAGSSPRVRGTEASSRLLDTRQRFIPACAGNRPARRPCSCAGSVHPRVCGEQAQATFRSLYGDGSSPRVRGTVRESKALGLPPRFIPACAGNSACARNAPPPWTVHPRVCGEQEMQTETAVTSVGSSPRVRGTAIKDDGVIMDRRFIPACAGNRTSRATQPIAHTVHPRVCGEQPLPLVFGAHRVGSSPRVRGTACDRRTVVCPGRFIPACAGNRSRRCCPCRPRPVHPRVCGEQIA